MQHVPLPKDPTIGYIEVPCLTDQEYDGGGLETFPARQGYADRPALEWKMLFDDPTPEFVAFMQFWQYFGSLSSVFGFAAVELFTKVCDDGSRVVDTSNLIAIIDGYVGSTLEGYEVQDGDLMWRVERSTKLLADLALGGDLLMTTTMDNISPYKFMTEFKKCRNPVPPEVSDSIRLLQEFLINAVWNYPSPFTLQQWREPSTDGPRNGNSCAAVSREGRV
ncbi:hypothetical protein J4E91_005595 [Alternaria rosae]|nr:hypothetical protein J4E91_005595 [Alternaria rosae]